MQTPRGLQSMESFTVDSSVGEEKTGLWCRGGGDRIEFYVHKFYVYKSKSRWFEYLLFSPLCGEDEPRFLTLVLGR